MDSTATGREGRHSTGSVNRAAATVATAATRPAGADRDALWVDGQEAAPVGQLRQPGDVVEVGGAAAVAVEQQHRRHRLVGPVAGRHMDAVAAPLRAGGQRRVGRHLQVPRPARADGRAPATALAVDPAGRVAGRRVDSGASSAPVNVTVAGDGGSCRYSRRP